MVTFGPDEGTSAIDGRDGIASAEKAAPSSRDTSLEDMSGSGHVVGAGTAGPDSGNAVMGEGGVGGGVGNGAAVLGAGVHVG
jgi:hypothetical protein